MAALRSGRMVLLTLAVAGVHLWLADRVLEPRLGEGAADRMPRRIEVAFVRELVPEAPPPAPAAVRPPPRPRKALAAAPAASAAPAPVVEAEAALPVPPVPEPTPEPTPLAVAPVEAPPAEAPAAAASAPEAVASAPSSPPFEWPPSTRLSYTLTGYFRGPVDGQAQVEWLRADHRYQVRLEVTIGPSFAPIVTRRLSSDGELTERGLAPLRYDEENKVAFRDARRLTILFEADRIRLPNGREAAPPPGVQDSVSQFVQLTWLFRTRPEMLEPGRSIEIPLALPRYVDTWTYDVVRRERLATPFGDLETVFVKPRRTPRPGVELTAELWVAPTLQYLPARIVIRQDAETYLDMMIQSLPLQAAPATGR